MWPWGHLAVGYLCYLAAIKLRNRGDQTLTTLTAVAFGTQFPDLIDKPLAWSIGILPSGRSFAHSLITFTLIVTILYWAGRRLNRREPVIAFAIGYLSHSLVDLGPGVIGGLLMGDMSQLKWTTYLLWPVLSSPPYPQDSSFIEHFTSFALEPYVLFQFALFGLAILVWIRSGFPGLKPVRRTIRTYFSRQIDNSYD